jgi:iron complex outermembrane recepter protein
MRFKSVTLLVLVAFFFAANDVRAQEVRGISGSVKDSTDNSPVAHAILRLLPGGDSTFTDDNGYFRFEEVPPGLYQLTVGAPGYVAKTSAVRAPGQLFTIALLRRIYHLHPILVTAQIAQARRSPVTFSNLTSRVIKDQYVAQDVPVILSQLPSITQYSENGEGIGYSYITMRGFDQRRISIMINGIPQNDPEDHNVYWIDVPDLQASAQTIQVQRGAGNEFYGAPAIGGSINLETNNLGTQRELTFSYGAGSSGESFAGPLIDRVFGTGMTRRYSATFGSGLVDNRYTLYAHLAKNMTDGYRQDSWVDLNSYFFSATRYDDNVTTTFNIYGGPISDGLSYLGLPKFAALDRNLRTSNWADWNTDSSWVNYSPNMARFISSNGKDTVYAVPRRPSEIENFSQPHFELLNEWKLSPSLTLNNSLFLVLGSGFYDYDGSWADTSYFRITSQYGYNPASNPTDALIHAYEGLSQYGWIPRLTIFHDNGTLVLGAELDQNLSDHWQTLRWAQALPAGLPAGYRYNQWKARTDVGALYGHELYDLSSKTTLMLDLEYQFKQYDFYYEKFVGNRFIVPYHFFNPRIGINYNMSSTSNLYFSASRTSREPQLSSLYNADESSGGETPHFALNADGTLNFGDPLVKPETLNDFELGYRFADSHYKAGVTAYWMDFYNELVSNGLLDQYGQPITGNAKRTRHVGLEIDGNAVITSELSLYGNVTFSSNKLIEYTSYIDSLGNTISGGISLNGNRISGFPEMLGNIRATYTNGELSIVLLGQYVGSQYTDNFNLASRLIDPYFIADAWISYKLNRFLSTSSVEFKLYVNNLLDRVYIAHGEGIYFFPAATRNFFLNCSVNL